MVELKKTDKFELESLIRIAYEGDEELLNKYHIEVFTLEQAIESTLWMIGITEEREGKGMAHYRVEFDEKAIGYTSLFPNLLYSFGINKNYRTEEIKMQWWERVCELLGDKFITLLYPNNTRAINFLKKIGMKEVKDIEQNCVTLLNL